MKPILLKYNYIVALLTLFTYSLPSHGQYWQQRADYVIEINFDHKNHQFSGTQVLTYQNNSQDTLEKVFYHLYFNAFQPNSMMDHRNRNISDPSVRIGNNFSNMTPEEIGFHRVMQLTQDGQNTEYHIEGTILEVALPQPIPPAGETVLKLNFQSQVPVYTRRSGRYNKEGIAYSMAQWYPKIAEYDEKGWHANPYIGREFYAPWGDYHVKINIHKKFILGATGELVNANEIGFGYVDDNVRIKRSKGNFNTWEFKAADVHDFVWAADPGYVHETIKIPEGPEVHLLFRQDSTTRAWEKLPEFLISAFDFANSYFGTYPYSQYSVIQAGDGGMEYPMATLITGQRSWKSLRNVVTHEMMHNWFQSTLATNESYFAWMDEGFTEYAEAIVLDSLLGIQTRPRIFNNYDDYYELVESGKEEPLSTHADYFSTNYAYSRAAYDKGAVCLAQLGYIIGQTSLKEGLMSYYNEWKFKHPDLIDFIRVMEKSSKLELDWYFDYWINSTKTIDYGINAVEDSVDGITFTITRYGEIPMPQEVKITKTDGSELWYYIPTTLMRGEKQMEEGIVAMIGEDWPWTNPVYQFNLDLSKNEISKVEIDPSMLMADIDRSNNIWTNE